MKKSISFFIIISLIISGFLTVGAVENEDDETDLVIQYQGSMDTSYISYYINGFNREIISINSQKYEKITINDESQIMNKGMPDIPNICRSIIIPDDKKMDIEVISSRYFEINNILVSPSKGILPRTINPDDVPYTFDSIYNENIWYPGDLATLNDPYILRDYRGLVVKVNPFQYNPIEKTLRVYTEINIVVEPIGDGVINVFERTDPLTRIDTDFSSIYQHHFINFGKDGRYTPVEEQGEMLVICYDNFYSTMLPFVEWKNMKGIPTEMINVSSIGSGSASDIDNFIETYYNTTNLTFVLLVGDIGQIPSLTAHGGKSDPSYCYINGNDYYPELFIGRFSSDTIADIETQVNRSINYEKNPNSTADWYNKGTGIASNQGTGDDGEYDWEHMRNIRTDLMNFTYTEVDEFYGGSHGGEDADGEPTSTMVLNALNIGRSIINYCGHGWYDDWSTSGFSNSDIDNLININRLPYIVCVACLNGAFDWSSGDCFAETWMEATHNNNPTGAITVFASSISQNWDEPMDAQDEIVDILIGSYPNDRKYSVGGLSFNGVMHMLDEYSSAAYNEAATWHIFGDPSLVVRTETPVNLTIDHDSSIMSGSIDFEVTVSGVEGLLCAISNNGNLLGYNYTNAAGDALITFQDPIEDMEDIDLVVTGFNTKTYIVNLEVAPPIRQPAEFEPMEAVLIRYPFGISYDIISEMAENTTVITIVASSSEQSTVESQYISNGVNTANCEYLIAPTNTYWTRDYGPWFRFNATTYDLEIVDFNYNRPRPLDNAIPLAFANDQGLNYSNMPLTHTGGNYMTDGKGIAVSTDLVYTENPSMTPDEINQTVMNHLGIRTYHAYEDPLGAYIEHVDCWGKFLSPDTILITEVPVGHSQYDEYEAAVTYFENQLSCYGTPYEVVRVYAPNGEPYTNSLILNNKVLVPQTGSSYDDDAIAVYETVMPGYEVLGFTGSWVTTDALHCRTKGIPDRDMIYIDHDPMYDQMPDDAGFLVEADMISYGNTKSVISPMLHWKNNTGGWNSVTMSADEDTYFAIIPNHACGETLSYYMNAQNSEGDLFNLPFIGSNDPFDFNITLVPDIWISPLSIQLWGNEGEVLSDILTIGNDDFAGENLDFDITITDNGGYSWLSVDTINGSIPPASSIDVIVSANTTGLNIGVYNEAIHISSDDPDTPMITIPVILDVVFADNVGTISVNRPIGQQLPGTYTVNATVENYGSDPNTFLVNCSIYEGGGETIEDFEDDDGGYTHNVGPGPGTADDWEWGNPTSGPTGAHSGSNCWATNLDGDHSNYADGVLDSIEINLNIYQPDPELKFWHWADVTTYDCGNVKISTDGGSTWSIINPVGGYPGTASSSNQGIAGEPAFTSNTNVWEEVVFDLSSYAGETVRFRWHFGSSTVTTHPGWYIDDVVVKSGIAKRSPGDLVYQSFETISLPAYTIGFVDFSPAWQVSNLSFYAIRVKTELVGDEDLSNDEAIGIVEIASAPEGHITLLEPDWNFVSLPFNQSVNKDNLIVNVGGVDYSWSDAVTTGLVSDFIFGWDRHIQSYNFESTLEPGHGFWIFAYTSGELKAPVFEINFDGYITNLMEDWNVIGIPNNTPIDKNNIIIDYNSNTYTWAEAVTMGILNDFILTWDSSFQSYSFSDILNPGNACWLYSYQECMISC